MDDSVFGVSIDDILSVVKRILDAFKKVMEWLGILVLPDEEDGYTYPNATQTDMTDILHGA